MTNKQKIKLDKEIVEYTQLLSYTIAHMPTHCIDFDSIIETLKELSKKANK